MLVANLPEEAQGEAVLIHARHLWEQAASLQEVRKLKRGTAAMRAAHGEPWTMVRFRSDDEYDELLALSFFDQPRT